VRFAVETWAPDYGAPLDAEALGPSDAAVDLTVERAQDDWAPIRPSQGPARIVLFVDGVQRIDARVWITGEDDTTRAGVCASWAAGVVRCDDRAEVVAADVERGVLCPGTPVDPIATRHGCYQPCAVPASTVGDPVGLALGHARGDLEGRVAVRAGAERDLLLVDGPLGARRGSGLREDPPRRLPRSRAPCRGRHPGARGAHAAVHGG
jgi:hypothetical protein